MLKLKGKNQELTWVLNPLEMTKYCYFPFKSFYFLNNINNKGSFRSPSSPKFKAGLIYE